MHSSARIARSLARRSSLERLAYISFLRKASSHTNPRLLCTVTTNHPKWLNAPAIHQWARLYSSKLPDHFTVALPALSPTMEQGTIVRWTKEEGDQLSEGDLLAEIETDKATMGFETPEEGYLAKIVIKGGTKDVPIGKLVCIIVPDKESIAAFKDFDGSDVDAVASTVTPPSDAPAQPPAQAPSKDYPPHIEVKLPALSPTMEKGSIASWMKNVGDEVAEGDVLCQIETDKAVMDFECSEPGYVAHIAVAAGTKDVPLGKLLCIIVEEKSSMAAFKDYKAVEAAPAKVVERPPAAATPSPVVASKPAAAPIAVPAATPRPAAGGGVGATPYARKLASERGIDLKLMQGTGPQGEIRAQDVENYVPSAAPAVHAPGAAPAAVAAPGGVYVDIPLTNVRQIIARRLLESKTTIPHYYLCIDVAMDNVVQLRKELNNHLAKSDIKLSVNDFIVKAASLACLKVPQANSSWQQDFIRQYNTVDMCIAVATDNGLITPFVSSAEKKGLATISQEVKGLAQKARENKLQPHEYQGGTFTISNLGMFGIKNFSAIINPPQACILAVGGTEKHLVPDADAESGVKVVDMMSVTLSCDHRVVDGAVGAQWLTEFKKLLEKPSMMLL